MAIDQKIIPPSPTLLVVNAGSSSIKFAVFRTRKSSQKTGGSPDSLCRESVDESRGQIRLRIEEQADNSPAILADAQSSATELSGPAGRSGFFIHWLQHNALTEQIDVVCHRIVHGGDLYHSSVVIDAATIKNLEALLPMAPLHQPQCLDTLKSVQALLPEALHIACFDTAFHRTMPPVAQCFAIPRALHDQGIKRYGFHGLSYQFIAERLQDYFNEHRYQKVLVAHLGSGASLCAMENGKSIATTMSFSPLDGLPMATRCGDIDAGAVLYMASALNMSVEEISHLLHNKSGLLGLSGLSGDVRALLDADSRDADFALDYFVYRICQEIGAMVSVLQGLDALVFTGGIGFHNGKIRQAICERLQWLGIDIDQTNNLAGTFTIHSTNSKVVVLVQKTDEEWVMANNAMGLLNL